MGDLGNEEKDLDEIKRKLDREHAEYLTVREAADYYSYLVHRDKPLDYTVIYRWIRIGWLRAERGPGVRTRIRVQDLHDLAAKVQPVKTKAERLADFHAWVAANA